MPDPKPNPAPQPDLPEPSQPEPKPIPDTPGGPKPAPQPGPKPDLPPAAQRALAEAEARRIEAADLGLPAELGGRDGPEPVRFGDWERKGIAVDF
ncbi:DUF1674 domain-containing protein [Sulfitobacter sabulilitoris]|uniref:DUF1674 domain-containing protein n=1 Tax=Sulfitobacter sabulilitoris TaxID=2562655 RepID=A0A5S3PE79_9RHOB|nr:DUF1674 domain-containing protein [Sulfitobacter sabulilitoris]